MVRSSKPLIEAPAGCRNNSAPPLLVTYLSAVALLFLSFENPVFADTAASLPAGTAVSSVRVWPAPEYTRLTFESVLPIQYSLSTIRNPDRVVIDLEQVMLTPELERLPDKIDTSDPYIRAVRIGRYKPGILRLVLDLKTEVMPQAFVLKPVGNYGHRLVLDVYPVVPPDPLMTFLNENVTAAPQADLKVEIGLDVKGNTPAIITVKKNKPEMTRLITVAIDPGHGGEDPGAISLRKRTRNISRCRSQRNSKPR